MTPLSLLITLFSLLAIQAPAGSTGSATDGAAAPAQSGSNFWVLLLALVAVFYFVMILPERKNRKKREDMLNAMKKGDKVMTTSGLYATIAMVNGDVITLQAAEGVRLRFSRSAIQTVLKDDGEGAGEKAEAKAAGAESKKEAK